MQLVRPGVIAWISGAPLCEIETSLGGNPEIDLICPRARTLVMSFIPLGLSFAVGLASYAARKIERYDQGQMGPVSVIECMASAIRKGFDTPEKLAFSEVYKPLLTRVQLHQKYADIMPDISRENGEPYGAIITKIGGLWSLMQANLPSTEPPLQEE